MRDAPAGTSLLQSHAEMDHRDRNRHQHNHHHNQHARQLLDPILGQLTSTVSVIQEVIVDQDGIPFASRTVLAATPTIDLTPDPTVYDPSVDLPSLLSIDPTPLVTDSPLPITEILASLTDLVAPSSITAGPLITLPPLIGSTTAALSTAQSLQSSQALPLTSSPFHSTNATSEYCGNLT
jgi:hypothetical protein